METSLFVHGRCPGLEVSPNTQMSYKNRGLLQGLYAGQMKVLS